MTPRSLTVQSVLYGNAGEDIVRAAAALSHSVALAVAGGLVDDWQLQLGDCSPEPALDGTDLELIADHVRNAGGRVEFTVFGENLGSAAGHNRLAGASASELILILNPDAQVAPDTVSALAQALVVGVGIAEARQVPFEHPKDYARYTGDTSWASTACALTTREIFEQVGGFDSVSFFLYCDDVDYSWRVRLAGQRVVYEPAAAVYHDKRLSDSGDWPASAAEVYYSAEAALFLAYKYSRPDVLRRLERQYRSDRDPAVARALARFRARRESGDLPERLDPDHMVAEFVRGNYAVHRY